MERARTREEKKFNQFTNPAFFMIFRYSKKNKNEKKIIIFFRFQFILSRKTRKEHKEGGFVVTKQKE